MTNSIADILRKADPLSESDKATLNARLIALRMRKQRLDMAKPLADLELELINAEIRILIDKVDRIIRTERMRESGLRFIKGGKCA